MGCLPEASGVSGQWHGSKQLQLPHAPRRLTLLLEILALAMRPLSFAVLRDDLHSWYLNVYKVIWTDWQNIFYLKARIILAPLCRSIPLWSSNVLHKMHSCVLRVDIWKIQAWDIVRGEPSRKEEYGEAPVYCTTLWNAGTDNGFWDNVVGSLQAFLVSRRAWVRVITPLKSHQITPRPYKPSHLSM